MSFSAAWVGESRSQPSHDIRVLGSSMKSLSTMSATRAETLSAL